MQPRYLYPDTVSFSAISDDMMQSVWNCTPKLFLREVIPRLLMMRSAPNKSEVMLLVQGTGAEKNSM